MVSSGRIKVACHFNFVTRTKRSLEISSKAGLNQLYFPTRSHYYSTVRCQSTSASTCTHTNSDASSNKKHFDVTIVGGGAVGSLTASILSRQVPSLKIALLDFRTPRLGKDVLDNNDKKNDAENISATVSVEPSARAYALSPSSLKLIGDNVMDRLCENGRVAFYDSMQIWESDGPATLHFTKEDIEIIDDGVGYSKINGVLGAVIEDEPLVSCLWDELRNMDQVDLISPASVGKIVSSPSTKNDPAGYSAPVELTYQQKHADGSEEYKITTDVLVAADGGNSQVRNSIGTFPLISMGYGRKAVTCTVALDSSINQFAFQRFQPNGPIALLPVWDRNVDQSISKHYANIVWSTTPEEAKELQVLSEAEFIARMNEMLQSGPSLAPPLFSDEIKSSMPWPLSQATQGLEMLAQGVNTGLSMSSWTERKRGFTVPPIINEIVGKRFAFDLNLMHAKKYVDSRVCLVGDAAHTIHPMAGQGLNLGMADAECLARHIQRSVESGMGIKDKAGLQYALQQYESERQREVLSVMGGIQFLHTVFSATISPAIHMRSIGMNIVNSLGPLRRQLVKVATGTNGVFKKV